jgi:hypothetical protein
VRNPATSVTGDHWNHSILYSGECDCRHGGRISSSHQGLKQRCRGRRKVVSRSFESAELEPRTDRSPESAETREARRRAESPSWWPGQSQAGPWEGWRGGSPALDSHEGHCHLTVSVTTGGWTGTGHHDLCEVCRAVNISCLVQLPDPLSTPV